MLSPTALVTWVVILPMMSRRLCFFCVCAKMNGRVAALKRQSRQGARDGLLF